jgi:hypothetical protein
MARRIYNKDLLNETLTRDTAVLVGDYDKLQYYTIITYNCKCGLEFSKKFGLIVNKGGAFCESCNKENALKKYKKAMIDKYGVESPLQSKEIQLKLKSTNLLKYGTEHPYQSKEVQDKTKATNLLKHGVENPFQSEKVKDKIKKTNLERFGVEYVSQSDTIQKKKIRNNLEKYGVEHTNQLIKVKEKAKATNLIKYGVENPFQSEEIKDKIKLTNESNLGVSYPTQSVLVKETIKKNNLKKYGVEHTTSLPEVKEKAKATNLIRYGVENAAQSQEIQEKAQKNAKKYKEFKFPSGTIRKVQGYEPFALRDLLAAGYTEEQIKTDRKDVPRITYYTSDSKRHYYFPDIFIPHENKILEVKSTWTYACKTDNIELKKCATIEKGYTYEMLCYDGKGNKVNPIEPTLSIE